MHKFLHHNLVLPVDIKTRASVRHVVCHRLDAPGIFEILWKFVWKVWEFCSSKWVATLFGPDELRFACRYGCLISFRWKVSKSSSFVPLNPIRQTFIPHPYIFITLLSVYHTSLNHLSSHPFRANYAPACWMGAEWNKDFHRQCYATANRWNVLSSSSSA